MSTPPVFVYDTNREALARRTQMVRSVEPGRVVVPLASRNAAMLLAASAPPGAQFLIDLSVTDRVALDRPGERLIRRLVRHPRTAHVRPVAWSAHVAPDVIHGVRQAGGQSFVTATLDADREREELGAVLAGEERWPAVAAPCFERWSAWFQEQFRIPWEPWIEPMLVRLASGEERRAVADELVQLAAAQSRSHAAARLRDVARAVAGEHSNSPSTVARQASLALAQIAAHRPLAEHPAVAVSLEHGAWTIAHAPSLVYAAGLTDDEVGEILAMNQLIVAKRLGETAGAGAPPSDRVRNERRWAAGQRAIAHGAGRADIDAVIDGLLAQVEEALVALDDARQDDLYHPEARAGVALSLLTPAEAAGLDGVEVRDGQVRWGGEEAAALAVSEHQPVDDLRALSTAADALVLRRTVEAAQVTG